MDNSDKIFEKIRNASQNEEAHEFPSMEKVWSRVESKLDQKVLTKQNKQWKKIAIAASFLLVFTVSYQIFKPQIRVDLPNNKIVPKSETIPPPIVEKDSETTKEQPNAAIPKIKITKPIPIAPMVAALPADEMVEDAVKEEDNAEVPTAPETEDKKTAADDSQKQKDFLKGKAFDARSVNRSEDGNTNFGDSARRTNSARVVTQKSAPLIIVDGKPVIGKSDKEALKEGFSKLDPDDIDNIVVLKEPLYIINGSYYSEQELFGPNPTSPYHPLSQQEIETLSILQGEKAIAAYGKKGEKGVVIITTKNGKPVKKAIRKDD